MTLIAFIELGHTVLMKNYRSRLRSAIVEKYGSVNKWLEQEEVDSRRFYDFMKGDYNPTLKTLERWVKTVDMCLDVKKIKH